MNLEDENMEHDVSGQVEERREPETNRDRGGAPEGHTTPETIPAQVWEGTTPRALVDDTAILPLSQAWTEAMGQDEHIRKAVSPEGPTTTSARVESTEPSGEGSYHDRPAPNSLGHLPALVTNIT